MLRAFNACARQNTGCPFNEYLSTCIRRSPRRARWRPTRAQTVAKTKEKAADEINPTPCHQGFTDRHTHTKSKQRNKKNARFPHFPVMLSLRKPRACIFNPPKLNERGNRVPCLWCNVDVGCNVPAPSSKQPRASVPSREKKEALRSDARGTCTGRPKYPCRRTR